MNKKGYLRYLLFVLMLVYAFNFMERMALGLVLEDIKADLSLSDTQLGVLTGIASALFYSVMGIPIARWADRGNRIVIIATMAALQCAAVALLGIAGSFLHLLLLRIAVSVGEAGCVPPAHSLIADSFSRAERPRAVARYKLGTPLAYLIGYFAAGWLNELYGWRMTFVLLSLPGLGLALLTSLTLREPRRLSSRSSPDDQASELKDPAEPTQRIAVVVKTLWANVAFRHLTLAFCAWYFFAYGLSQWQPAFFIRSYGLETGELGMWLAAINGVAAGLGTLIGGELAARFAAENERRQLVMCAAAFASLPVILIGAYLVPHLHFAFAALAVGNFIIAMTLGPIFGCIQTFVAPHMRATSIAIVFLCANLIGMGFGPLAVGTLSDAMQPMLGKDSLRYALAMMCPGLLWAAWHLWRAGKAVGAGPGSCEGVQKTEDLKV